MEPSSSSTVLTNESGGANSGNESEPSPAARAKGVEAIFLSPADPEEGVSGQSGSKELWRHAQQKSTDAKDQPALGDRQTREQTADFKALEPHNQPLPSKDTGDKVSNKHKDKTPVDAASSGKPTAAKSKQQPEQTSHHDDDDQPPVTSRRPFRKSRSVTDVDGERESQASSAPSSARGRRMSISVTNYSMPPSSSSRDSSRRSSNASIVISISRPDSPVSRVIQQASETSDIFDESSLEFLRIRRTASTVHMATRLRHSPTPNTLTPEAAKLSSQETAENLIRMHRERRNSMPAVPRLNLKGENSENGDSLNDDDRKRNRRNKRDSNQRLSDTGQHASGRRHGRRRSSGSSVQGFYMPASRPSSAIAGAITMSRPSSSATIIQLGKLSRPWTPVRSPSPVSVGSGNRGWRGSNRSFFRNRTPTSIAAPLQALNQKVSNLLGCASNILDFYNLRPDIKKDADPLRQARLLKSKKMNDKNKVNNDKPLAAIPVFNKSLSDKLSQPKRVNQLIQPMKKVVDASQTIDGKNKITAKIPQVKMTNSTPKQEKNSKERLPKLPESTSDKNNAPIKQLKPSISNLSAPTIESNTSSASSTKSKGLSILKSMVTNQTSAAASALMGKSIPLPVRAKISKKLKIKKQKRQFRPMPTKQQHHQSTQNLNQGPPTLVNFFKRANRSNQDNRAPIKYETFTDKDRAAAVLLGDADIKTTLEKQMKSERGRYVLPKESPAQVYLAQADFEMRIGGLATARKLLNKALELQPGDKNALCSRSRCRLQMGDTKGALDDAEEALNNDPNFVKATYQKAEVLYQVGRFEEALVFYHKGCKQRPDMELFHQGVRKAQEAIEVSLGVKQPTIQQQQQHRTTVLPSLKKPWTEGPSSLCSSRLPPLNLNGHGQERRFSRESTTYRETSLLGDLHVDKLYLERLLQNPGLHNQSVSSQKIIHHAKETLEYLKARENFWKQQQPSHIVYSKEKIKFSMHRRRKQSSVNTLTSTDDSGTERDQQTETDSSVGSGHRLVDDSSSTGSATERETASPAHAVCSSEEVSNRILASAIDENPVIDEGYDLEEWRDTLNAMTECTEKQQTIRCVHIFLSKCWRGPNAEDELTAEIESKMKLLRFHDEQEKQCGVGNAMEKTNLTIEMAVLYLASKQLDLSTSLAQQAIELAKMTGDRFSLVQLWLLMAALQASAGNSVKVETYLSQARQVMNKSPAQPKQPADDDAQGKD